MVATFHPTTLAEALKIRACHVAIPCAGGTDLLVKYRRGAGALPAFTGPVVLLDRCEELRGISAREDLLHIGALTTLADLAASDLVHSSLREAALQMGGPALRTIATIGGNVCNASPAGDTLPFLYAFDAQVRLVAAESEREVPLEQFIVGPGKTSLRPDEILSAILIPTWSPTESSWRKVGTRRANALTKVSVAAFAERKGSRVLRARIAVGSVGPTVIRLRDVEQLLEDVSAKDVERIAQSAHEAALQGVHPIDDQRSSADYRRTVAANLVLAFVQKVLRDF